MNSVDLTIYDYQNRILTSRHLNSEQFRIVTLTQQF